MPRPYSEKFLLELNRSDPKRAGVQLAKVCVEANLPAKYVAEVLGVTRMTVYSWFRGKPLRDKNQRLVEILVDLIAKDLNIKVLPVTTMAAAKDYLNSAKIYIQDVVKGSMKD